MNDLLVVPPLHGIITFFGVRDITRNQVVSKQRQCPSISAVEESYKNRSRCLCPIEFS